MDHRIRLYTHEVIVHSQIASIEKAFARKVEFEVSLNQKAQRSVLEFSASDKEMQILTYDLGYNILVNDGQGWTQHL